MKPKKFISGLLAVLILAAVWGSPAGPAAAADPTIPLEKAITIAKEHFQIPPEFDQFTSDYEEYRERSSWILKWGPNKSDDGGIYLELDALTGDIRTMRRWSPGEYERGKVKLSKLSKAEALGRAETMLKKLQPERFSQLELVEDPQRPSFRISPYEPARYEFRYVRQVEGIPFPSDGVRINVNGDTGLVTEYYFNWTDLDFPAAQQLIDGEEAEKIFAAEYGLELIYYRPWSENRGQSLPVKLVYQLQDPEKVLIDAQTGQKIELDREYYGFEADLDGMGEDYARQAEDEKSVELTPQEEKAVTDLDSLLRQEKALQIARDTLKVPAGYVLENSSLRDLWDEPGKKVWQFSWRSDTEKPGGYSGAEIDAQSGEIISFSSYRYDSRQEKEEPRYNEEQAKELALKLVSDFQPVKAEQLRYRENDRYGHEDTVRSYYFTFERMVNGIPFPQNGFNVTVDAVSGQITNYRMRWSDAEFPTAEKVISREQAAAGYLDYVPLVLEYLYPYGRPGQERLVYLAYHFRSAPYGMLDAHTGDALDWQGKQVEKTNPAVFSDIAGHPVQEDIELLAEAGIIQGTDDGKFRPDEPIAQAELAKMLLAAKGNSGPVRPLPLLEIDSKAWYAGWMEQAIGSGLIIEGEIAPESPVIKEMLAVMLIRHLGYDQPASLPEIYRIDFNDQEQITFKYQGHVALAYGFNLLEPEANSFHPQQQISRAEAVTALVKVLRLE